MMGYNIIGVTTFYTSTVYNTSLYTMVSRVYENYSSNRPQEAPRPDWGPKSPKATTTTSFKNEVETEN